jgi:BirA family biotin operon repressor/biotin-[acetyl-CoA-carboxylase] ligase
LVYVNALAVLHAVKELAGPYAELSLKWPNDLLLGGKKVAGSLLESRVSSNGQFEWIVVGTGVNIVHHPESSDVLYPATSLHKEGHASVQREALVHLLLQKLETGIRRWVDQGFGVVRKEYLASLHHLGSRVRVGTGSDRASYLDGTLLDVSLEGALILKTDDGRTHALHSGDVVLPA